MEQGSRVWIDFHSLIKGLVEGEMKSIHVIHNGSSIYAAIDNRTGEWKAYEGLTWAEPYPVFPIGD